MSALAAAVATGAVAAVLVPANAGRRRLAEPAPRRAGLGRWQARPVPAGARRLHRLAAGLVAAAMLFLLGLPWGLPFAAAGLIAVPVLLSRLEPASVRRRRERVVADLPLAVDLLAACLRAGRPPAEALGAVALAIGGPLGERFTEVEQRLSLGADPVDAWQLLEAEPACAAPARAIRRTLTSGGPLAQTLEHLASDARQRRRWAADERARAVETRSVVPLGLCFLPAFVLIGIVPTIAGSLSGLFGILG